ncbi:hypothetical protein PVL29_020510 [Vitis rotundifolia]|uniref:Secreted protein n=1 Tax=Vitis rotundifolia TaxID=103349 RepID=A0AA38YXL0_VITRO|nr:hypothetical protein PVL29_020510 [Vitis rotundifolia]
MVCLLLLKILLMGRASVRSAKTAPFWTKAWWERESEETNMTGREFRRTGSKSDKDLRNNKKFPMRGTLVGPGGRFSFGKKKS